MVFVSEYGWEHRAEEVDDSSDSIPWIVKADTGGSKSKLFTYLFQSIKPSVKEYFVSILSKYPIFRGIDKKLIEQNMTHADLEIIRRLNFSQRIQYLSVTSSVGKNVKYHGVEFRCPKDTKGFSLKELFYNNIVIEMIVVKVFRDIIFQKATIKTSYQNWLDSVTVTPDDRFISIKKGS